MLAKVDISRDAGAANRCFTTALLLLYYCFTTALLLLYYCFTTALLLLPEARVTALGRMIDRDEKKLDLPPLSCFFNTALLLLY
jgi:hypothetical protein